MTVSGLALIVVYCRRVVALFHVRVVMRGRCV